MWIDPEVLALLLNGSSQAPIRMLSVRPPLFSLPPPIGGRTSTRGTQNETVFEHEALLDYAIQSTNYDTFYRIVSYRQYKGDADKGRDIWFHPYDDPENHLHT